MSSMTSFAVSNEGWSGQTKCWFVFEDQLSSTTGQRTSSSSYHNTDGNGGSVGQEQITTPVFVYPGIVKTETYSSTETVIDESGRQQQVNNHREKLGFIPIFINPKEKSFLYYDYTEHYDSVGTGNATSNQTIVNSYTLYLESQANDSKLTIPFSNYNSANGVETKIGSDINFDLMNAYYFGGGMGATLIGNKIYMPAPYPGVGVYYANQAGSVWQKDTKTYQNLPNIYASNVNKTDQPLANIPVWVVEFTDSRVSVKNDVLVDAYPLLANASVACASYYEEEVEV